MHPAPGARAGCEASQHQALDAGTSIGANIEEGRAGQSKADFIAKNFISLKESRETRFWLRVIGVTDPPLQNELQPLLQEATEFIAMLTTSLKNARLFSPHEYAEFTIDGPEAVKFLRLTNLPNPPASIFIRFSFFAFRFRLFVVRFSFFVLRFSFPCSFRFSFFVFPYDSVVNPTS